MDKDLAITMKNYREGSKKVSFDLLVELAKDIQNDRGLHNALVFNNWRKRNNLKHVQIKDIAYLFRIGLDENPEESIIKFI